MPPQSTPEQDLVPRLEAAVKWATRLRDDDELLPAERELIASTLATLTNWSAQTASALARRAAA